MRLAPIHDSFYPSKSRMPSVLSTGLYSILKLPSDYLLQPVAASTRDVLTWLATVTSHQWARLPSPPRWAQRLWHMLPGRSLVRHYASLAEEQDYWDSAARWKRYLAASDDRLGGLNPPLGRHLTNIPLIMSYVPRLLPTYRESVIADDEESEYELAPVVYLKWHKMVYPGKKHPSIRKATKVIKQLSSRDRREIYRISRILPDEVVFHKSFQWTPEYRDLWASWLNSKELDLAIVFQ